MSSMLQSDLYFDSAGRAGAPAILLIHGSVVTRKMWLPQLHGLSDEFQLIAPDLPGHGALAEVPFSLDESVQRLAALIRQETAGRALVAGLSLGGYVAIELATRHPSLVSGLVLSGCSFNFTGITALYIKLVTGMMRRGWIKQSHAQAEEKTRRMIPAALAVVAEAQLQAGVYPEALGPSLAELAGVDFTLSLSRYPGPGLILNGERDRSPRAGEARFAAVLHPGRVQVVPGAGHACNLDNVQFYNQAVRDFARSIAF